MSNNVAYSTPKAYTTISSNRFILLLMILLILVAAQSVLAQPDVLPYGVYNDAAFSPTITVLESNPSQIRLHLVMEHLPTGFTVNFAQPLPGLWGEMNLVGVLLPRFSILVALPNTGNPTVQIDDWQTDTMPALARTIPENNPNPASVTIGEVGILGGVRVAAVTFRPITYTNNATSCQVMTDATITILIDNQTGTNPVTQIHNSFSRPWQKVFQAVITNWASIPNVSVGAESHILMIAPASYIPQLQSFIAWKEQRGIKVSIISRETIGVSPTSAQIRNRIVAAYNAFTPRIDYVILVGDESQLTPNLLFTMDSPTRFSGASLAGQFTNEGYFAGIEGDDVFPDVFLGRWVVNLSMEVLNIATREVMHERDTFIADSLRFSRAVTAADFEDVSQIVTKRKTRQMLLAHGFPTVDTLWGQGVSPQTLSDWVNEGETFVNYRGSGWNNGWAGVDFDYENVSALSNHRKLPIVTGIGCGVGKFDVADGTCFGEVWMLAGNSVLNPTGAAGFIGPCWNTHTIYNDVLDSSLYRGFLTNKILNLSPALAAAKMMEWIVMAQFLGEPQVHEVVSTLFRQYLVLSDPSLQVFTETPKRLSVALPAAVPAGSFPLLISIENAVEIEADSLNATVWLDSSNFVTRWIPRGQSFCSIPINTTGLDTVCVTLTGDNVLAYQKRLPVGPSGPMVVHRNAVLNDATGGNGDGMFEPGETVLWGEVAWNVGSQTATGVTAVLSSTSSGVTINQANTTVGDIVAGDTAIASPPFQVTLSQQIAARQSIDFSISYSMTNGSPRTTVLHYPLIVPDISLTSVRIEDNGNEYWERGEEVWLHAVLRNMGRVPLLPGTCTLSTQDEFVTLLQNQGTTPVIPVGGDYTFPVTTFRMRSSLETPASHQVTLTLAIAAAMGTYQFTDSIPIVLTIGQVTSADPFCDNSRRYWVYDNADVLYTQRPVFDWYEIAPAAQGHGTAFAITASDSTIPVRVPFTFSYFGVPYDTLSISTDGWVHCGRTTGRDYSNQTLPNESNSIQGLIAPLWDDLFFQGGETGQLCYYYDVSASKFIVEWYQVHHWQSSDSSLTFQLQLLNPAIYPTPSGDAEWILQYQAVPGSMGPQGATIGMEDPTHMSGFTYVCNGNYAQGAAVIGQGSAIRITTVEPSMLSTSEPMPLLPQTLELGQNYPNPFNPETIIEFALPTHANVKLEVFNLLGQKISTVVNGQLAAGRYREAWRGMTDAGVSVPSGLYFYRLQTPQGVISRKMILLR